MSSSKGLIAGADIEFAVGEAMRREQQRQATFAMLLDGSTSMDQKTLEGPSKWDTLAKIPYRQAEAVYLMNGNEWTKGTFITQRPRLVRFNPKTGAIPWSKFRPDGSTPLVETLDRVLNLENTRYDGIAIATDGEDDLLLKGFDSDDNPVYQPLQAKGRAILDRVVNRALELRTAISVVSMDIKDPAAIALFEELVMRTRGKYTNVAAAPPQAKPGTAAAQTYQSPTVPYSQPNAQPTRTYTQPPSANTVSALDAMAAAEATARRKR